MAPSPSRQRSVLVLAMILAITSFPAMPQDVPTLPERFYQERFCAGLDVEIRLGQQRRADCLSQTHSIEVDWHDEWKDGIGRAMAHGAASGLLPGLVLVCRSDQGHCLKSSQLARQTLSFHHVHSTLWDCLPIDKSLAECKRWDM